MRDTNVYRCPCCNAHMFRTHTSYPSHIAPKTELCECGAKVKRVCKGQVWALELVRAPDPEHVLAAKDYQAIHPQASWAHALRETDRN